MGLIKRLLYKTRKYYDDDFDWDNYTQSYQRRLKDNESQYRTISTKSQLSFDTATGKVKSEGAPIPPRQNLILEAIGLLAPSSVHEIGCGSGDNLANGMILFPKIRYTGGDRGHTQLELALSRHPQLKGQIGMQDITMPYSHLWPQADLVYTSAVTMHIHTAVSHFVALANMVRMAESYVLLIENWQCHNYVQDIQNMFKGGHLDWSSLYIHRLDGSTGARGILLSKFELKLPILHSDSQMREGAKASAQRLKRGDKDSARGLFGFIRSF